MKNDYKLRTFAAYIFCVLMILLLSGCPGTNNTVKPVPDPTIVPTTPPSDLSKDYGRLESKNGRWYQKNRGEFSPQYVMLGEGRNIHEVSRDINGYISHFITGHGFNGFNIVIMCAWYGADVSKCRSVEGLKPSNKVISSLENIIKKTYASGGLVHLWMWGDKQSRRVPSNPVQTKLFDMIKKRLYPLKGWSMNIGYDNHEWLNAKQADDIRTYLNKGQYKHLIGARGHRNSVSRISAHMDFESMELHKQYYTLAYQLLGNVKPVFSEDRFRVRKNDHYSGKDPSFEETLTLMRAYKDAGVAAIWGNMQGRRDGISNIYPDNIRLKIKEILNDTNPIVYPKPVSFPPINKSEFCKHGKPPNELGVIQKLANKYPRAFKSCSRSNTEFVRLAIQELRKKDLRWGLNWVRGKEGGFTGDAIGYCYDSRCENGNPNNAIVGIITDCGGEKPRSSWQVKTPTGRACLNPSGIVLWAL